MERHDDSARGHVESLFSHLDRHAGTTYNRIRGLVEEWLARYPKEHRHELQQRLRSRDDVAFHSAFLELFTHELLAHFGYSITVHPEVASSRKRPDFRAANRSNEGAFVECVVATGRSDEDRAAQARLDSVYQAIDRTHSPDFYLSLQVRGKPKTPVPGTQWRRQLQAWLEGLDYEAILAREDAWETLPTIDLRHDGLTVRFRPIPKGVDRGNLEVRPIGVRFLGVQRVASYRDIRESLRKKASKYGELDAPFLVVVNCIGEAAHGGEVLRALYGRDGLWSSGRPSSTRLSGVIAALHLYPWSVAASPICLFHNPHASRDCTGQLSSLPQGTLRGSEPVISDGIAAREVFGLPAAWPETVP